MNKKHFIAIAIYFGVFLIGDILTRWLEISKNTFILINFTVFPVVLLAVSYLLKEDLQMKVFREEAYSFRDSLIWIGKYFIIGLIGFVIIATIMPLFITPEVSDTVEIRRVQPLMIIPFTLFGPILEELIFRRILLVNIYKKVNIYWSIGIISIIFAAWHLTLAGFPVIFWQSLIYSYSYYRTNRLFVPITLHIMWNSLNSLISLL